MKKQVTVLMSTYNGEKYLRQQVDSILNQTGVQVRLLVRDDGSTDQTLAILQEYQDKGLLRYYQGANLKTARSFIQLVHDSPASDYYAFSDQDDVWLKDKLNRALSMLASHPGNDSMPLLYAGNFQMVDANLNKIPSADHYTTQTFANAIVYSCCTGCTMVMNRALRDVLKNHPLPQHMLMHDDWVHKVCLAVGGQVIFDSQPMMLYRQHGNNVDGGIHTLKDKVKKVWGERTNHARIMSGQLEELQEMYGQQLPVANQRLLKHALRYGRGNLSQRVQLAFDPTYAIREKPSLNHEFRISLLMNYW